ncbi:hypothetical protein GBAR_LOCUS14611 [Geodia barretti]|uniref:Uncharacterized protein n=1 Tax=Geodia barretti TaxID=519541 RepID=A0AA35SAS8_GEOBA|nr:hypothetical protein GBAR_LOCUS14611 [Geodia barretti]
MSSNITLNDSRNLQRREKMAKEDLERCRESAETQRLELETRLTEVDKTLADERHNSSSLTQENRSLKIKLGDLQSKVVELTKAQKEYQECVSKAEETKKSEMQMLFEEMTQHIQQQSDSHKYVGETED